MDGLAKPERSGGFGADRVLGFKGAPTGVGDEKKRHGRRFFDASHRERSELGEICTLAETRVCLVGIHATRKWLLIFNCARVV